MDFFSDYNHLIDGKLEGSASSFDVINPATEQVLATVPDASKDQFEQAVAASRRAFKTWSKTPREERQAMLEKFAAAITEHQEDLMRLLSKEQGKARAGAEWEVGGSAYWVSEIAKQALPVEIVEDSDEHYVEVRRTPLGVVGGIVPWNFPILLAVWKIAPALAAGNTIIIKPSPFTPLCTLKLGELAQGIFPPGVINILNGGDDLGIWMTSHPDINKISFTGSTETGRKVMSSASANLKRVTLELGGNDAAIVLPDVDPKAIAQELFWTAFQNSAQFCVACKRLYVHESIYDEVLEEMVAFARTVKVGDGSEQGTDLGPIQNKEQFDKVCNLLEESRNAGLNFALGGDVPEGKGYFVPIAIVDNPPEDSRVVVEEAFGPVLPLLKYDKIEDVIARANNTSYGLAGSVWSKDLTKAKDIAEQLETGTVWINEAHVFAPNIAFGGHKQSGMGVENSLDGLSEYTNSQTITIKKNPAFA